MAQIISVRLQRGDNTPWGFRLQGGKDFGSPLLIQKVNGNSIAERAGLQAGDAVIRVNSTDIFNLRHKEAQDAIVRAGQNFELTVQRGSQTWKPAVTPVGSLPSPKSTISNVTPVTKTSLAANKPASKPIGSGHNVQPKPFLNGSSDGPKLVNKQYNSPIGLYSEESIAETLSAQAEVLPTGALGVNFKKNERHYDAQKSEVLKMLQETENEPRDPEPEVSARSEFYSHASHAIGGRATSPRPLTPLAQKLGGDTKIPQSKIVTQSPQIIPQTTGGLTPPPSHRPSIPITQDSPVCTDCERVIVGVFVRIKDKNLHVECFKCSTCGTSLKNVGYYNINNKLYCDIHAKLAARSNQPAPNMVPITIAPGGKAPVGAISAAIASHGGPISPSLPTTASAPLPYTIMNSVPVTATNGHANVNGNASHDYTTNHDKLIEVPALRSENIEMFSNKLKIETTPCHNERKINRAVLLNNDHLDGSLLPVAVNGQHNLRKNGLNAILHENKKTYLTEAKIRVNNNFNGNNDSQQQFEAIIDVNNRLQNNKPPPSVLGPKPFSSSTAPLSPVSPVSAPAPSSYSSQAATLPRAATQNQQPGVTERTEIETSSSYSSVEQKMSESKQIYSMWPPEKVEEEFPTASPIYIPPTASNPVFYPKKMIKPEIQIQQAPNQTTNMKQTVENQQITDKQHSEKRIEEQHHSSNEQHKVSNVEGNITEPNLQTQMSVCSQEVSQINTRPRSTTECVETISGTLDTQMFVEHIKEQIARPPSPPPPGVLEEKSKQLKKAEKQVTFEKVDEITESKMEMSKDTIQSQDKMENIEETAKKVINNVEKQIDSKMQQHDINISSGNTQKENQVDALSTSIQECAKTTQQNDIQSSHVQNLESSGNIQQQSQCISKISEQKSEQMNVTYKSEFQQSSEMIKSEMYIENSESSQKNMKVKSEGVDMISSLINPVPKEWKSPLVTALTTAAPTPYSQFSSEETISLQTKENLESSDVLFPHTKEKIGPASTLLTSNLIIAPSRPFTPVQDTNGPISLPEETKPYMPPDFPKTPLPKQPEKFDPKTRFLDALTVAPTAEYKPVTKEIIRQRDDLMKELPAPPYPNIDLVTALTTAPERPFTPVWIQSNTNCPSNILDTSNTNIVTEQTSQKESERKYMPPCPKIVKAETIKPPTIPSAKPFVTHFPPVSDELKSAFKPVTTYGPSKITQSMSMSESFQDTDGNKSFSEQKTSHFESSQQDFEQISEEMSQKGLKLQVATSEEIIEEKVGTIKIQSEQYALRKPDEIPTYQRSLSPFGVPKRAVTPVSAFQEFAKEHESLLSEEFTAETAHKKTKQSEVQRLLEEEKNTVKKQQILKEKQMQKSQKQFQEMRKEQITKFKAEEKRQEIISSSTPQKPQPTVWRPTQAVQPVITKPSQPIMPNQIPVVSITQAPTQKVPVQTIQPGQAPPNIPKMTFQPVIDKPSTDFEHRQSTPSMSSRPARALTPSLINNPAPVIPYYQLNLSPVKYSAPETNLYDPKSPEVSRAPTPRLDRAKSPVGRPQSPFTRSRSPAAGPPPNPLRAQAPRMKSDSKQFKSTEAYNLANQLSQVHKKPVQFSGKYPSTQHGGHQATTTQFSESMKAQTMNIQAASSSQQKSVETSLDGSVQIQRKKTVTEEFERTRKQIDIERATNYSTTTVHQQPYQLKSIQDNSKQQFVSVQSAKGMKLYETSSGKPIPTPPISKENLLPPQFPSQPVLKEISIKPQPMKDVSNSFPTTPGSAFKAVPQKTPQSSVPPQTNLNLSACPPVVNRASKISITPSASKTHSSSNILPTNESLPNSGAAAGSKPTPPIGGAGKGKQAGAVGFSPRRGRGILNTAVVGGARVPLCGHCNGCIRGPFITALGKIWCPEHFVCATPSCRRALQDLGFVEERGQLYCEYCFEQYLAPICDHCHSKIKGDCLKAIGKHFHPECFSCAYCKKLFGNSPFFLEDGLPYCEADWNELFTTKCFACGFPVEAGDRWVEALNNNYHSQCFNCTMCKKNLEGQSFFAKGGRPFCKNHAR